MSMKRIENNRKIAVCGKGGSGKSTVVALLARGLQDKGARVLVVDSDESNPGLYRVLGFEQRPAPLLELVGGKKQVFPTFSDEAAPRESLLPRKEFRIADPPGDYVVERDGIGLVCIGKILQSLEGCACPIQAQIESIDLMKSVIVLKRMPADSAEGVPVGHRDRPI
jgi:CO dehydrogenase maturation factor